MGIANRYSYPILVTRRRGGRSLAVRHGILGILAEQPCHGYELKSRFDLLTGGFWELNAGQVYSTLERLAKEGLVLLDPGDGDEDRKVYRITPSGQAELARWLARPPLKPRPHRDELLVRLGLLLERDPNAALALLEQQKRIGHIQMAELTRRKLEQVREKGQDRLRQELLLDWALLNTEAELKWLDTCEEKLRRHQDGG